MSIIRLAAGLPRRRRPVNSTLGVKSPMRFLHIKGVNAKADFAQENGIDYRYRLEITRVGAARAPLTACFIMQNPSYAGEQEADKSVQFLEKNVFELNLPEFNDVGCLVVVNQYARIQTNGFLGLPSDVGLRNDQTIREAIRDSEIVVVAWGSSNRFEDRKRFILDLIKKSTDKTIYKTKMHPSRGRYASFILPFDA